MSNELIDMLTELTVYFNADAIAAIMRIAGRYNGLPNDFESLVISASKMQYPVASQFVIRAAKSYK